MYIDMLTHPVLVLFIRRKWKRAMKYFLLHTAVFLLFLITYYLYINTVFQYEKKESDTASFNDSHSGNRSQDQNRTLLPAFLDNDQKEWEEWEERKEWHLLNEICFLFMTILLFCLECFQFVNFGIDYFKQLENLHQVIIILTAIIAMVLKPYSLEGNIRGEFVRGAIACGFCISCFEFIFVVGKYPFRGGDFSIMFARVLRKLVRYVIAMFMIVAGFSVGLNVITYGTEQAFEFENPFKSFVLTLTMAMGEFNADNLYEDYENKLGHTLEKDLAYMRVGRTLAMMILVCMILAGTITMINLFVAVIISDREQMDDDVFKQKLFYMAEGSELIKKLFPCDNSLKGKNKEIEVCVHKICGSICKAERISQSIERIVPKLIKLAEENWKPEIRDPRRNTI